MNAISFIGSDRLYDKDASSKQVRNPYNSFVFLNKFLGALQNDQDAFQIAKKYYEEYITSFDPLHGTVIFELEKFQLNKPNEKITLRVEEVVGMILKSAKKYAEAKAEVQNIKDCVITVPINWSLKSRIALVQAARIAGLVPINLIHENTGAALHYGVTKQVDNNFTAVNGTKKNIIFYNMGATNIQASLVEYTYMQNPIKLDNQKVIPIVTVLADYGIQDVGGYAYDLKIAQYFADEIDRLPQRQGMQSFKENRKGMVKLLKECNKVKEILSANKETQFFSEGLLDGADYKSQITRSTFEQISEDLIQKVIYPVEKILQISNKTVDDVDSVELIGGGIRMPKIQQILTEKFGQSKIGYHLNGDESMALGAVFLAANYSSQFRVKKIHLYDGYNFEVRMKVTNLNPQDDLDSEEKFEKETQLFPMKRRFGSKKTINLKHDKDIALSVYTVDLDGNKMDLARYNITNITSVTSNPKYKEHGPLKLSLHFELGTIRVIDLSDVEASLNITQVVDENKNKKDNSTDEEKKVKHKLQKFEVDIYEMYPFYYPLNQTEVERSSKKLERFDKFQEQIKMVAQQRNNFESLIYQIREYSTDKAFLKFSRQEDVNKALQLAEDNSQWLESDEVNDASQDDFKKRYQDMENIIKPVLFRQQEHDKRYKAYNEANKQMSQFQEHVDKLEKSHPWVSSEEKQLAYKLIKSTKEWMTSVQEKQKQLKLFENPAYTAQEVQNKVSEIKKEIDRLKAIKKPPVTKPKDDGKKEENKKAQDNKGEQTNKEETKQEENKQQSQDQSQQQNNKGRKNNQKKDDL